MISQHGSDCGLKGRCGQAPAGKVGSARDQAVGDVVPVALATAICMRRGEQLSGLVAEQTFERRRVCR